MFGLIVDNCKVESYIVRDQKAYKLKEPEVPYSFHHSVGNRSFIGFWGYPFVFNGCFINWSEFHPNLPDLDLDTIFVVIERDFSKYKIEDLRKKYPNATIFAVVKETWNWGHTFEKRLEVYNQCDMVLLPVSNSKLFSGLESVKKEIHFLPQPVHIEFLYDHYYQEERSEKIFSYLPIHNATRYGMTRKFTERVSSKYKIPYDRTHTQNFKNQWEEFLKIWTPCTFHFNLDPAPQFPGQQAMQCAALGVVHIGGINDSHFLLWPETATNDQSVLEEIFSRCLKDHDYRIKLIQYAWDKVNEIYSYDAIKNKFEEIFK